MFVCTNIIYKFAMSMASKATKYCTCLYHSANAFARVISKMADEAFAPTGLSTSYAFLLMTVNETPGIQPKIISCHMQLTPSTVTRLIEKMEYRGFTGAQIGWSCNESISYGKGFSLKTRVKKGMARLISQIHRDFGKTNSRSIN